METILENRFNAIDRRLLGLEGNMLTLHNDFDRLEKHMEGQSKDIRELKDLIVSQNGHKK